MENVSCHCEESHQRRDDEAISLVERDCFAPVGLAMTLSSWRLIIDPPGEPAWNMGRDERLARLVREGAIPAVLRIYQWNQPAISLGRRQTSGDIPPELLTRNLPIVQRPTGGGAVVHTLEEVTYSLSISRTDLPANLSIKDLPLLFHRYLKEVLMEEGLVLSPVRPELVEGRTIAQGRLSLSRRVDHPAMMFCFSTPVCGDLLYQGKKVAGSALRAWKDGILIQGSLQGLPVSYNKSAETVLLAARRFFNLNEENVLATSHCCRG